MNIIAIIGESTNRFNYVVVSEHGDTFFVPKNNAHQALAAIMRSEFIPVSVNTEIIEYGTEKVSANFGSSPTGLSEPTDATVAAIKAIITNLNCIETGSPITEQTEIERRLAEECIVNILKGANEERKDAAALSELSQMLRDSAQKIAEIYEPIDEPLLQTKPEPSIGSVLSEAKKEIKAKLGDVLSTGIFNALVGADKVQKSFKELRDTLPNISNVLAEYDKQASAFVAAFEAYKKSSESQQNEVLLDDYRSITVSTAIDNDTIMLYVGFIITQHYGNGSEIYSQQRLEKFTRFLINRSLSSEFDITVFELVSEYIDVWSTLRD